MVKSRLLSNLALGASFFALGVIALGALTRLMDAGLGCPDWPGCYGHFVVTTAENIHKAWLEMIHRYFVGGLSAFIIGLISLICYQKNYRIRSNVILAICLAILLCYQILLGALTIYFKLSPIIVSQHLLGGFFILTILWLLYLNNRPNFIQNNAGIVITNGNIIGTVIACLFLLFQISLGAWTSTHYASLSCPDFPFCINQEPLATLHLKQAFTFFAPLGINYEGGVLPDPIRQTIHMMHRIGALVLTLYFFIFAAIMFAKIKRVPELIQLLYIILVLLAVQICIGIANVIFQLPLITAISHTIVAALLLISLVTFLYNLICMKLQRTL